MKSCVINVTQWCYNTQWEDVYISSYVDLFSTHMKLKYSKNELSTIVKLLQRNLSKMKKVKVNLKSNPDCIYHMCLYFKLNLNDVNFGSIIQHQMFVISLLMLVSCFPMHVFFFPRLFSHITHDASITYHLCCHPSWYHW